MKALSNLQKILPVVAFSLTVPNFSYAESLTVKSPMGTNAVIELYTSEGCSSCPPADKWISNYSAASSSDDGVIALAFHVDYWNYLGWEDVYSKPEFTERQRLLGSINKQRTIYTPEFFVNASETRRTGKIPSHVAKINNTPSTWDLTLTARTMPESHGTLSMTFKGVAKITASDTELYLALYENNIVRKIRRGENRNKTLNHDFVVRDWVGPVFFEDAEKMEYSHTISFPADSKRQNTGIAAILVNTKSKLILQAVKIDLKTLFADES